MKMQQKFALMLLANLPETGWISLLRSQSLRGLLS
jgi:hypothetical protein